MKFRHLRWCVRAANPRCPGALLDVMLCVVGAWTAIVAVVLDICAAGTNVRWAQRFAEMIFVFDLGLRTGFDSAGIERISGRFTLANSIRIGRYVIFDFTTLG